MILAAFFLGCMETVSSSIFSYASSSGRLSSSAAFASIRARRSRARFSRHALKCCPISVIICPIKVPRRIKIRLPVINTPETSIRHTRITVDPARPKALKRTQLRLNPIRPPPLWAAAELRKPSSTEAVPSKELSASAINAMIIIRKTVAAVNLIRARRLPRLDMWKALPIKRRKGSA